MRAHIYLRRDQETKISSYLWTDIMTVFKSFVLHGITCSDTLSISLKCRAGSTTWHAVNIIALLFSRQLLIGSVSARNTSFLLIKICILGQIISEFGISSSIRVYLIDLLSGNVHKALNPFLTIPYCLYCMWQFVFASMFSSSKIYSSEL